MTEIRCSTLPTLFQESAAKHAHRESIDGNSYDELRDWVTRYVSGLKAAGIGRGDAVCLLFGQKSAHAAALALATMQNGAVYVPLDPTFPAKRLCGQCRTIGNDVKLLVHGHEAADRDRAQEMGKVLQISVQSAISIKSDASDSSDCSSWNDLAMVLFTSGSSGPPKATAYKHKHLSTALQACTKAFSFTSNTRVCNAVPYIWDGGNLDLFGPLLHGGAVCFAHSVTPASLARDIVDKRCTWILLPPSLINTMSFEALSHLDVLVSGGESATIEQFQAWNTQLAGRSRTRLFHAYGLTETGMINMVWEYSAQLLDGMSSVPVGRPISDNVVAIDSKNEEIVLSGPQIVEGYLGDTTSQSFLAPPNAFSTEHHSMRTGDSGWQDEHGLYHIGGRLDGRLSILSLRIEPAEPENAALLVPGIDFAHLFVLELGKEDGSALVLAYHVDGHSAVDGVLEANQYRQYTNGYEKQLREQMVDSVPDYQRPSAYLPLASIPRLTSSNKKDGKRIAAIALEAYQRKLKEFPPFSPKI